jgi:hypothetical protein
VGEGDGSVGDGDGVSDSVGVGEGVSDSVGVGDGVSDSVGVGDGVSDSVGVGDGVSDSVGDGEGVSDSVGDGDGEGVVGVGVGVLVGFGEGFGSGGNPPTPNLGMDPEKVGGSALLIAACPETWDERARELPGPLGTPVEGDREGPFAEGEPASSPPAATWWFGHVVTATPIPRTRMAAAPNFIHGKLDRSPHQ